MARDERLYNDAAVKCCADGTLDAVWKNAFINIDEGVWSAALTARREEESLSVPASPSSNYLDRKSFRDKQNEFQAEVEKWISGKQNSFCIGKLFNHGCQVSWPYFMLSGDKRRFKVSDIKLMRTCSEVHQQQTRQSVKVWFISKFRRLKLPESLQEPVSAQTGWFIGPLFEFFHHRADTIPDLSALGSIPRALDTFGSN